MTVNVISRTDEHCRNWMADQKVSPRIIHRIHNFRDATYIKPEDGYVLLTPMEDQREEERIRELLKSRRCRPLSVDVSEWPLTEFA